MTPATIIESAAADGVMLAIAPTGRIEATGKEDAVSQWLPLIRAHKAEIIEVLKAGAAETATASRCSIRQPSAPLTACEETAIRAWLALIGEIDPVTIAEVIDGCQRDVATRRYFVGRAAAELPTPAPFPDDRRTSDQCANLIARRCHAAKRGEIAASRNYEPIRDQPRRCEGYAPGADDIDQRPGEERWLGLTDLKGTK